jgi:hypothetical protein
MRFAGMVVFSVVFGIVLVVVVLGLLLVWWLKELSQYYERFYGYLVERGVSKVEVIPPKWCEYGRVRLYDREGRFLEELVVRREDWWFVQAIVLRLRKEGFEVEVKRV